jgi:hypothetical protein
MKFIVGYGINLHIPGFCYGGCRLYLEIYLMNNSLDFSLRLIYSCKGRDIRLYLRDYSIGFRTTVNLFQSKMSIWRTALNSWTFCPTFNTVYWTCFGIMIIQLKLLLLVKWTLLINNFFRKDGDVGNFLDRLIILQCSIKCFIEIFVAILQIRLNEYWLSWFYLLKLLLSIHGLL